jgi:hypothetical protein
MAMPGPSERAQVSGTFAVGSTSRPERGPSVSEASEETIFVAALEKDAPAERAAYLEAACGGDDGLRRRVEALLRAHEQSGDLLDPPVHDAEPRT